MHPLVLVLLLLPAQDKLVTKDLVVGKGAVAATGDLVTVEFIGKLASGKQVDSSKGRPPFSFTLGAGLVIPGWDKGLAGMKVGGKRHLTIPPAMGFGAQGDPPSVPANATLKYEVQLLHVWKKGAPSKIQIVELKPGKGRASKVGDNIEAHYKGRFLNGVGFDSSIGKAPYALTLGGTGSIRGFDLGLTGMKVGQKRRVTVPPELAYGEAGRPGIPPNATLVFELEMVKIK